MNAVRVPRPAVPLVKTFLADVFGSTAQVRSNLDDHWTPDAGPVIVVADDGGTSLFPVATRRTVRITAYANGEPLAHQLVSRAWGELLSRPVPGLAHVREGIVPFDAGRDRKHRTAWLASCTVLAAVRTTTVA
ncbi:head-to-tail connector complex protein [Gordonia phage GEazy]|nr:head-to-tail connector complex protein [Gordonia phage GEazy]QDF16724.1 head-to-tail terminator [Gordonia phage HannahD]